METKATNSDAKLKLIHGNIEKRTMNIRNDGKPKPVDGVYHASETETTTGVDVPIHTFRRSKEELEVFYGE